MAGLIVYLQDGTEYYNSETHSKLVYQQELTLTGWVTVTANASYYCAVPWLDPTIHMLSLPTLTISNGRVYMQDMNYGLSMNSATVITTSVYRIV